MSTALSIVDAGEGETDGPIGWTGPRWNPIRGCEPISPGCKYCYAEAFAARFEGTPGHPYELGFRPRIVPERLFDPLRWRRPPARVFVNSMSDPFQARNESPIWNVPWDYVIAMHGVMAAAEDFTFQMLTKRGDLIAPFYEYFGRRADELMPPGRDAMLRLAFNLPRWFWPEHLTERLQLRLAQGTRQPWPLPNLHLGVSVELNAFRRRLDAVVAAPTPVPWVSLEPLLELVDIRPWLPHPHDPMPNGLCATCFGVHSGRGCDAPARADWHLSTAEEHATTRRFLRWVVAGGESGNAARPCNVAWLRQLALWCELAGVPFFLKQLGQHAYSTDEVDRDHFAMRPAALVGIRRPAGLRHLLRLRSKKGADPREWTADLQHRQQFPTALATRSV